VPGADFTSVQSINNQHELAGYYTDSKGTHGFVEGEDHFITIDVPNATFTAAQSINAGGEVVGWYSDANYRDHGFLYDDGVITTIDVPGADRTLAFGITDDGQVAGTYTVGDTVHGFITSTACGTATGVSTVLGDLLTSQGHHVSLTDIVPGSPTPSGPFAPGSRPLSQGEDSTDNGFGGLAGMRVDDSCMPVRPYGDT
jgi:probable HAF family extracellular repeat protein